VSVIDSTHFINRGILCLKSSDVDHHINEEDLNSLDGQVKTCISLDEISGSHGSKYEDDCLLGRCAV
jgi:hypothetical protein